MALHFPPAGRSSIPSCKSTEKRVEVGAGVGMGPGVVEEY
jgi:hypothetical protein